MKALIEIPKGSTYKYEFDSALNALVLDRPLNQSIPENYGFFPESKIQEDGDELDVFVISESPLMGGSYVDVEIVGVLFCTDSGVQDDKIIATLKGERTYLVNSTLIQNYLKTYKQNFIIERIGTKEEALELIERSKT